MDHKGSRFHIDIERLEEMGMLSDGCTVVADNVLLPGAPLYLWRACRLSHYDTNIISLREFAGGGLEDWMAVSQVFKLGSGKPRSDASPVPKELSELAAETDRL